MLRLLSSPAFDRLGLRSREVANAKGWIMKVGISTWLWVQGFTADRVDLLKKIASIGFEWVEFPLEEIDQFEYGQIGSILRDLGLIPSLTAVLRQDRDLTVDDPARNRAAVDYLKHSVDAVVALGGNRIGGGIYGGVGRVWNPSAQEREQELERVAKYLRPIGQYAVDQGVIFGIETLIRFRSSFINTIMEALELANRVSSPGIQVMADTFHMNVEEKNVAQAIEQAGSHLVHVHANENDRSAPGSGNLDWNGIRGALQRIGYDGALVIESFGGDLKEESGRSRESRQDAIAREGCQFLKRFFA